MYVCDCKYNDYEGEEQKIPKSQQFAKTLCTTKPN